jgi:hypothetical protein
MSAFIVEDKTINRVVTWISLDIRSSLYFKQTLEKTLHIDTSSSTWKEQLGKACFQLNIDGVNERYGAGEAKCFRELNYRYAFEQCSIVQVLKSMQC